MTPWLRQLSWAAAVLALSLVLVGVSSWRGFGEILREHPVLTQGAEIDTPVVLDGALVTIASAEFGDSETFDVRRVDDESQQILRISTIYAPSRPQPGVESCAAQLTVRIDGLESWHQPRFSLSEVACEGTSLGSQQSQFYFVLPRGEITDATLYLQVGGASPTWLETRIR